MLAGKFFYGSLAPSKDVLSRAVYKYIITDQRPFSTIQSPGLVQLINDVTALCGVQLPPDFKLNCGVTMKDWVKKDGELVKESIKLFWEENVSKQFFALTIDEKKAVYKQQPLLDIVLHAFLVGEHSVQQLCIVLAVDVIRESKTAATIASMIKKCMLASSTSTNCYSSRQMERTSRLSTICSCPHVC